MIVTEANPRGIKGRVRDLVLRHYDRFTEKLLTIRVNGVYNKQDKVNILTDMADMRIPVDRCDIFVSGVDEENRLELTVGNKWQWQSSNQQRSSTTSR